MKRVTRIKYIILISMMLGLLFILGSKGSIAVKEDNANQILTSDKLLRLHVVANSNSLKDQQIKRRIREVVLKTTTELFKEKDDVGPEVVIKNNKNKIRQAVERKLQKANIDYGVRLKLGEFNFPTRSYGNLTLESGNYQALKVVLGEGEGENWWCVLFPPLCFVDSIDQVSDKELEKLSSKGEKQIPVEFKLKCVEVVKDNPQYVKSRLKLIKILSTSFPGLNKLILPGKEKESGK